MRVRYGQVCVPLNQYTTSIARRRRRRRVQYLRYVALDDRGTGESRGLWSHDRPTNAR